jgi:FtsH-binding integral membrane protein
MAKSNVLLRVFAKIQLYYEILNLFLKILEILVLGLVNY